MEKMPLGLVEQDIAAIAACLRQLKPFFADTFAQEACKVLRSVCKSLLQQHSADVAHLTSCLLCDWRDVLRLKVHVDSIACKMFAALIDLVGKCSLVAFWSASVAVNGFAGLCNLVSQVQTMVTLCRNFVSVSAVSMLGGCLNLQTAVDCFCQQTIGWHLQNSTFIGKCSQLVGSCLEWQALLCEEAGGLTCSSALTAALLRVCSSLVEPAEGEEDPALFEQALWCLQYAGESSVAVLRDGLPAIVDHALERYGARPKCVGACAACLLWLLKQSLDAPVQGLVDRCVSIALARKTEEGPPHLGVHLGVHLGWFGPVTQLLHW
jgi:hypothetical protein